MEPYIMASMGIPKYALAPWLILWFGIGDLPKLVVVTLVVFYILFITTFAGIRGVDQRLIDMARIIGANETVISREIIWTSLLPFFFTGLKIAFPRAVSATIVGEFLVSTQGVGRYIEHARQVSDTTGVFAGIVIAIALVLAINAFVNLIDDGRCAGVRSNGTWSYRGQSNETCELYSGRTRIVRRRER